jgi:hypothetical protein
MMREAFTFLKKRLKNRAATEVAELTWRRTQMSHRADALDTNVGIHIDPRRRTQERRSTDVLKLLCASDTNVASGLRSDNDAPSSLSAFAFS